MTTETLSVPDVTCSHCKMAIETAIAELGGIESVSVDIPAKTVALAYDHSAVSLEQIVEAIGEAGYEVAR